MDFLAEAFLAGTASFKGAAKETEMQSATSINKRKINVHLPCGRASGFAAPESSAGAPYLPVRGVFDTRRIQICSVCDKSAESFGISQRE